MKSKALQILVVAARNSLETHEAHNAIQEAVLEVAELIKEGGANVARVATLEEELRVMVLERDYYENMAGVGLVQLESLGAKPSLPSMTVPDSIAAAADTSGDDDSPAPPRLVEDEPESTG